MNLLCWMFGHKSLEHYHGGAGYMEVRTPGYVDGIGREHCWLWAECPRCGVQHVAGTIHRPAAWYGLAAKRLGEL